MMEVTIFSATDIQQLEESLQKIRQVIIDCFNSISDDVKKFLDSIESFMEYADKKIEEKRRSRAIWIYSQSERLRPLLLDRRLTVHRCRNCC